MSTWRHKTRYSSRAWAFRLPHFAGYQHDSNWCSVYTTQRREQRHQFRAFEAYGPGLNEPVEPVEFCRTSEDGHIAEQSWQGPASPSCTRRDEPTGEFFVISIASHHGFRHDGSRLRHQYQRLKRRGKPAGEQRSSIIYCPAARRHWPFSGSQCDGFRDLLRLLRP